MKDIIIDAKTSIDLDMNINAIDQANINSLIYLDIKPFDKVNIIYSNNKIFSGIVTDTELNIAFGQKNYSYTVNSPLFLLKKTKIENSYTTFLQLFLKQCCDMCNLYLDYRLDKNPIMAVEKIDYFSMLKKSVIYTKNYNTRFYIDYENNKLVFTDKTDGFYNKIKK
ncbi:hypothetical protein [Methanothermococcus okinawensis]|uniref:Uncharacterized protein n=1 Tax=Methanothermococcus okinawensis (strain DSM 14208 / JCM 11175 / IH1) TaxID=647113 RepID=F8AKB1_METOI|nr:hypothetical protein [Methanothermococcus okinawensis]AEH06311.1 hypothetical protein Metok_0321 [Methanothermococcus okinawensis IH1]